MRLVVREMVSQSELVFVHEVVFMVWERKTEVE